MGYISEVAKECTTATSNRNSPKPKKFFDFYIHSEKEVKRAICFSPSKRKYLADLANNGKGAEIKRIKTGHEIVLKDDVKVFEKDLKFEKLPRSFPTTTIQEILFQRDVYERVNIEGTLHNLSNLETKSTCNGNLQIKTATAVDACGEISISLFNNVAQAAQNKHYKITDLTINTFNGERLLKTTERTKLQLLEEDNIAIDQEDELKVLGKVVSVNINNLKENWLCPSCKFDVTIEDIDEDDVVTCGSCSNMCVKDALIINDEIQFIFTDSESNRKYDFKASAVQLAEAYGESENTKLAKAMLRKTKCIRYDDNFKVISISDI